MYLDVLIQVSFGILAVTAIVALVWPAKRYGDFVLLSTPEPRCQCQCGCSQTEVELRTKGGAVMCWTCAITTNVKQRRKA